MSICTKQKICIMCFQEITVDGIHLLRIDYTSKKYVNDLNESKEVIPLTHHNYFDEEIKIIRDELKCVPGIYMADIDFKSISSVGSISNIKFVESIDIEYFAKLDGLDEKTFLLTPFFVITSYSIHYTKLYEK